jgi:hypothetical protein
MGAGMSGGHEFGPAGPDDAPALQELAAACPLPGRLRLVFERSPDLFRALRVEGREALVHVCRERGSGRIVGCGHRGRKPVFVDGRPAEAGWLGGLRLLPAARGRGLLARGYAYLRRLDAAAGFPMSLTTILGDNHGAQALLTSGRAGLPGYHDAGRFRCILARPRPPAAAPPPGLAIRRGSAADAPAVLAFLTSEGPRRQFFPVYQAGDFGPGGRLLHGLAWDDLFLAWRGDTLAGLCGAWDQHAFRRWRVAGYARPLALLRHPLNLLARARRLPALPPPGTAPRFLTLALPLVAGDDREVFRALLAALLRARGRAFDLLLAGLHERDPLWPVLAALPHLPLDARLYRVAWPGHGQPPDPALVPYLETGSL